MAVLQSLNVLQFASGTIPPASSPSPVVGYNSTLFDNVQLPTASQLRVYPTAGAQISIRYFKNAQQFTGTAIVTQAPSAIISAS